MIKGIIIGSSAKEVDDFICRNDIVFLIGLDRFKDTESKEMKSFSLSEADYQNLRFIVQKLNIQKKANIRIELDNERS